MFGLAQLTNNNAVISITEETTLAISAPVDNQGHLANEGSILSQFDFISANYTGSGNLTLVGVDQTIDVNDTVASLTFSGSGTHNLASPLYIAGALDFISSKLMTNGNLKLLSGTVINNPSEGSYLVGALTSFASGDVLFPIGTALKFSPIILNSLSSTSGTAISFFDENPNGEAGRNLLAVSEDQYWQVDTDGTFEVSIPLTNVSLVQEISELAIARGNLNGTFVGLSSESTGTLTDGNINAIETSGAGIYTLGRYFDESLRELDSLALVGLYDQTGGSSWSNSSGWKSSNLDDWFGVTLSSKRPANLDLSNNGLVGNLEEFSALDSLKTLNLSNNALTDVPDFTNHSALTFVDIAGNQLGFAAIEVNQSIATLIYAPQDSVLNFFETLEEKGTTYTFNREISGSSNSYAWYKATPGDTTLLTSETATHQLDVEAFSDEGYYFASVTSGVVPDLKIITRPIFLKVSSLERDSTALRSIYSKMNGDLWEPVNWLSSDLENWDGLTIENSRVSGISLPARDITGKVPNDILDIRGLKHIDLSDNSINAIPGFAQLPVLTNLDLSDNLLEFGDLEPNVDVPGIVYSPQKEIGMMVNDTLPTGTSVDFSVSVEGSANSYQWHYTGTSGDFDIDGANGSSYTVPVLDYSTMGTYQLNITSNLVPELTLRSAPKKVLAASNVRFTASGIDQEIINDGTAYLLKVLAGKAYDSVGIVQGSEDGYLFKNVVLGDYIAAIEGDLDRYLPTYYPNTDLWVEAEILTVRQEINDTIFLVNDPELIGDGEGEVRGVIESEFVSDDEAARINARRKVKRAGCSVRRFTRGGRTGQDEGTFVLVAYVQSDDEGRFRFEGLEDGRYRFNVEYPGIPMDEESFVEFVFEDGSEDNLLVLEVLITDEKVSVIKVEQLGFFKKYFDGLEVYPNPADDYLKITYEQMNTDQVTVELMNLSGKVLETRQAQTRGKNEIEFNVSGYKNGIYLLHFTDSKEQSHTLMTYKVLVNHK
ncbi:MAG: T9SS type A sorting domain-containing protein [Cyclobacteriaceae bacterium]